MNAPPSCLVMKFSSQFVALQHRYWGEYYLDYNGLKRILAELPVDENEPTSDAQEEVSLLSKPSILESTSDVFLTELYRQVEKMTLFVMKEQGEIADALLDVRNEQLEDPQLSTKLLRDGFNKIGATLFHLIQFVDLNVKAILRILKKHDKRRSPHHPRAYDTFVYGHHTPNKGAATMMESLRQTQDLDALCVTLQEAYTQLRVSEQEQLHHSSDTQQEPNLRLLTTRDRSRTIVREADLDNDIENSRRRGRSPPRLHRRHRSVQGLQQLFDGGDKDTSFHLKQEDFIMAQIYAARRNLKQDDEVLNMLATTALGFLTEPPEITQQGGEDAIKAEFERHATLAAYKRAHKISGTLNYVSSFIYMANYLVVVPTIVSYSQKLGADPSLSSAIVGMTPFATIFSTVLYSWWTSYSYRIPLLFAASLNVVGNVIYALGYPCNSMTFVLLGRLLSGLGSCRPINRRYIADAYSTVERTAASATFVAVGSFGMALGPFLGSVLHRVAEHSSSPYWQVENAPGWFMAVVWFVYCVFHVIFFVDPPKEDSDSPLSSSASRSTKNSSNRDGEKQSLLPATSNLPERQQQERRVPIWKNAAVMVNFFIYFIEKLLMECVSSSTSLFTFFYFDWPGSWAGYYLSFLCLLVLPVNLLVANLSKVYQDREMMLFMQAVTILGCVIMLQYGETYYIEQYLVGTCIIVVFSNMVEGPNMSLLSKTIPKSWRKGFLNVGLLATEAATLGRTAGDAFLALCGSRGIEHQLNYTFGSMVVATVFTLWLSYRYYDALVPTEDKTL